MVSVPATLDRKSRYTGIYKQETNAFHIAMFYFVIDTENEKYFYLLF